MAHIDPHIEAIESRVGEVLSIVTDDSHIVAWMKNNLPFPKSPGSTVEWQKLPSAKTIIVSVYDQVSIRASFEELTSQVSALDSHQVFILWHDAGLPVLSMPLWACTQVIELLTSVPGQEMHFVCPEHSWYIELDPFFSEFHAVKIVSPQ